MRASLASALVVLAAVSALGQTPAQEVTTFKAGAQIVYVPTMVADLDGRLVPNLEQEDFTILDNGKPQQIAIFEASTQPFTAVVTLDFSASMTSNLKLLKDATEQFLLRMLPQDQAQVGAFSDRIQFSGTFTNDRDDLIGALDDLQYGNPTRLWDAVDASIDMLDGVKGRKVVVVFTDGEDTASRIGFGRVLDHARQRDVMVYAIGLTSEILVGPGRLQRTRPDRSLKKLAEETGGGYFELKKTADLAPTFTRVAQELHSLYNLGFSPVTLDGKEHKLEVKMRKPGNTARARRSYVASAERISTQ
jgi:Ca-activated chloride channel homolog